LVKFEFGVLVSVEGRKPENLEKNPQSKVLAMRENMDLKKMALITLLTLSNLSEVNLEITSQ